MFKNIIKKDKDPVVKKYNQRLKWRKRLLRLIMLVSLIFCIFMSVVVLMNRFSNMIQPQINRAIVQVAKLLPQLESNENAVREVYAQILKSREKLIGSEYADFYDDELDEVLSGSLSWMERITKLKVGRDGYVFVVSKSDGTVLAHPVDEIVGNRVLTDAELITDKAEMGEENIENQTDNFADIDIEDLAPDTAPENLDIHYRVFIPYSEKDILGLDAISNLTVGSIASYKDTYIICGIGFREMFEYLFNGLVIVLVPLVLIWVFIRYICFHFDSKKMSAKALRPKLFAYSVILSVLVLGISWYMQVLSETTGDLKTMEKHAQVAVETLDTYRDIRSKLNDWLDKQYLIQCKIAASFLSLVQKDELTREDMNELAELLDVKHIYIFDKTGKVVVTNSPYDHLVLSSDKDSQLYAFQPLLDGVDHIIQEPQKNDVLGEYMQYIGVSIRDENDLCDGFVLIGVDPLLRDQLIEPLNVDTVLSNLVIGLPKYAVAIDKDTLRIAGTTGIGYKGQLIEELGVTDEALTANFSGFLWINGTEYYAGFSESSDLYLVPIVPCTRSIDAFLYSLMLAAVSFVTLILIIITALFRYDRMVIEEAPKTETEEDHGIEKAPENALDEDYGLFSGFSNLIKVQNKFLFDERWKMNTQKGEQTPETRIRKVIYRLLLIFCIINLIPVVWYNFFGNNDFENLNGLAYIIMGKWEKGFNIFAVSSCVYLLFILYVMIILANRILYHIAKVSDTRVETVCLLLRSSLKYICAVIFIYFGLSQFGVDTQTLLASAGILSLVIGLGAKDLVNDIIAGFFIIFEGTFKVGDWITVGNFSGVVTQIGIRTTKVTFFSNTKIFNNSTIRDIINSDGMTARILVYFPVSYDVDLLSLEAIFEQELPPLINTIPGLVKPPRYQGVSSFENSSIVLRIALFVEPYMSGKAKRAMQRELKLIFDRHGIEFPYPQVVVHNAAEIGSEEDSEEEDSEEEVSEEEVSEEDV